MSSEKKSPPSPEEVIQGKIHIHMTGHGTGTISPSKLAILGMRFGVFEAQILNDLALAVRESLPRAGFA